MADRNQHSTSHCTSTPSAFEVILPKGLSFKLGRLTAPELNALLHNLRNCCMCLYVFSSG